MRKQLKPSAGQADPEIRDRSSHILQNTTWNLESERSEVANLLRGWALPVDTSAESPLEGRHFQLLTEHATAFRSAGLIHLYRELYDVPPETPEVQSLARSILQMCGHIIGENGPTFGLLWPLFTGAVNLIEDEDMAVASELFATLAAMRGMNNVCLASRICQRVWRRRLHGVRESHWHQAAGELLGAIVLV